MKIINSEYKQRNMKIWNEIAPRYHKRWASVNKGPFQSTKKLIELIKINKNNRVLDVACGTGVVTKEIQKKVGKLGYTVGIDTSTTAIKIAKKWNNKKKNLVTWAPKKNQMGANDFIFMAIDEHGATTAHEFQVHVFYDPSAKQLINTGWPLMLTFVGVVFAWGMAQI
mgnify:CR=1 FL=1